jgi:hypothetical protein
LLNTQPAEFYLTGGTALSRCYLHHRYSDDLDFFVNDAPSFQDDVLRIQKILSEHFSIEVQRSGERFRRFFLFENDVSLKIECINDVPFHFGNFQSFELFQRVDNPLNILSNKITAIMERNEAKDFADIFSIVSNLGNVDWKTIFVSASSKSAGIFPPLVAERIAGFAFYDLEQVHWQSAFDRSSLRMIQQKIVQSIIGLER